MKRIPTGSQQSVFSRWLRTGRLPSIPSADEVELKFNPWHDPEDGRFTFTGSGNYHGPGGTSSNYGLPGRTGRARLPKPQVAGPTAEMRRAGQPTRSGTEGGSRGATGVRSKPTAAARVGDQPNPGTEFIGGVGEGLYGVAQGTVAAAHSVLTTNPATTVRNVGRGMADTIDKVIAAEDSPATIQVSRATDAIANASARQIGRATGSVVGNAALTVAPGAALGKVSALRRLRDAVPHTSYDPPQIGWVKENLGPDTPAKRYNDSAPGARPGQAPTLMRTMADGSKRPVKFDGVQGEYLIDRSSKSWTVLEREPSFCGNRRCWHSIASSELGRSRAKRNEMSPKR